MLWAAGSDVPVDAFVCLTDNETWFGNVHPHQALAAYRAKSGIPARFAAIAFSATEFSIADDQDPGSMNFAGFDTAAPNVLAAFIKGE